MQGQQPTPPTAWSGGAVPASVRKPPAKRSRPPTRAHKNPNAAQRFVPPKDLAAYLVKENIFPKNPLNRPKSQVKYGVRVEYGTHSPYYTEAIRAAISHLTPPAGFVDARPYKGYIDIGYPTPELADEAALQTVTHNGVNLPVYRTSHSSSPILAIYLSGLPSHLPCNILRKELLHGLSQYGSDPALIFDTPRGFTNLAGPTATATVTLPRGTDPSTIPSWVAVPSATDSPFWARFDGAQPVCQVCHVTGHIRTACPQACTSETPFTNGKQPASLWGTKIPRATPTPRPTTLTHHPKFGNSNPPSNPRDTNQSNLGFGATSADAMHGQVHPSGGPNLANQRQSATLTQRHQDTGIPPPSGPNPDGNWIRIDRQTRTQTPPANPVEPAYCEPPPITQVTGNPFEILDCLYVNEETGEPEIHPAPTPMDWCEETFDTDNISTRPKNRFREYVSNHAISKKIKNKTIPIDQLKTIQKAAQGIIANSRMLSIPDHAPEDMMPALLDATPYARQALETVAMLTLTIIASREQLPDTRNTTKLIEARMEAEGALMMVAMTLNSFDALTDGSTPLCKLSPHPADLPTPWLSAFERLPIPAPEEPDPPPNHHSDMD